MVSLEQKKLLLTENAHRITIAPLLKGRLDQLKIVLKALIN